jgi:hypothetical protein
MQESLTILHVVYMSRITPPKYVDIWYSKIPKDGLTEMNPGHPKPPVAPKTTEGQSLLPVTFRELLPVVQGLSLTGLLPWWNAPEKGESQGILDLVFQVVYGMGKKDPGKQLGVPTPAMSGKITVEKGQYITDTDGRRVSLTPIFRQRTNNRSWSWSRESSLY